MGAAPSSPRVRFLWRLRAYYRQVAGLLVVGSIAGIAMNIAVVLPAVLLGRAINVVLAMERHRASTTAVVWAALEFLAGTAATELPRIGKRYWLGVARNRFRASVRSDVLRGVLAWPMETAGLFPVGDVMARAIGDVEVLGTGVGEVMVETWDTLLFSVSLLATMLLYDPGLAALALAPAVPALSLAKLSGRMVARRMTLARETESQLTGALREQLGGLRLLRLFGRTRPAIEQIRRLAGHQARAELSAIGLDEALAATYTTMLSSGVVFIIWLGGRRVVAGSMSLGALVTFLALFVRFTTRAPRIPQMANRVQAAGAAYRRLEPLLATPLPVDGEPPWSSFRSTHVPGIGHRLAETVRARSAAATLRFADATFCYPGSSIPAIANIDLEVAPGAFVAVTGPVGSGKSTLARLAAGLYPPGTGRVDISGCPASTLGPELRAQTVGYLAQEPQVFSGSVAENLSLWSDAGSRTDIGPAGRRAIALAALDGDLEEMPDGVATEIGELGIRVSGGQRQRIALARAVAASGQVPGLLVLDDPFSAVDVHTETAILAGLREAFGPGAPAEQRTTILLLSHRLAAFPLADLVVVLDHGHVTERGTHGELLASSGLYAQIARAQARIDVLSQQAEAER